MERFVREFLHLKSCGDVNLPANFHFNVALSFLYLMKKTECQKYWTVVKLGMHLEKKGQ